MRDAVSQSENLIEKPELGGRPSRTQRVIKWLGYLLIGISTLALFYGAIAYFAWQSGTSLRTVEIAQNQQVENARQVTLAREDIDNGRYELALSRLDWVLARDGQYEGAAALRVEAENGVTASLITPTLTVEPAPTQPSTPTPDLAPTQTAIDAQQLAEDFDALEALMTQGEYETAVDEILAFQALHPEHRREETDEMLYTAYVNLGLPLLGGDEVAVGLFYLERARDIRPLSDRIEGEVTLAELYVEGVVFFEVNWDAYFYYFRQLCTFAPTFHDACTRFYEGLLMAADQRAAAFNWCQAESLYAEAETIYAVDDETLLAKLEQATAACLTMPTPGPEISGTLPLTNTVPITTSEGAVPLTLTIVPTEAAPDQP